MSDEIQKPNIHRPMFDTSVPPQVLYDVEAGNIPEAGLILQIPRPQELHASLRAEELPEGVTPISRGQELRDAKVIAAQTTPTTTFDIARQPEIPSSDEANPNGLQRLDVNRSNTLLGRAGNFITNVLFGSEPAVGTRAHHAGQEQISGMKGLNYRQGKARRLGPTSHRE